MSQLHELKTDVGPFQDVWSTRKTFELRKDDRQFQVNDVLRLREMPAEGNYTGREILVLVIHMLRGGAYGLPDGYVTPFRGRRSRMISIDKLKSITHLVTHASCPDGIASALIVKDALPDVKVSFVVYGSKEHRELKPEPGMLFCDFTPHIVREVHDSELVGGPAEHCLRPWLDAEAVVLDHHPTSKDFVDHFSLRGLGFFGENELNECGAWLAYEHVWLPLKRDSSPSPVWEHIRGPVRDFARRASVRDTWKTNDRDWELAMAEAALRTFWKMSQPISYYTDDSDDAKKRRKDLGDHLAKTQLSAAQCSLKEAHHIQTFAGTRVWMFQGVSTTSDAAEIADQGPDLVVGFHYRLDAGKLQLQFSTRSHTGFDCASFAKAHGGGGHKAAAGFTVEVSPELSANPYQTFRLLLEQWEGEK